MHKFITKEKIVKKYTSPLFSVIEFNITLFTDSTENNADNITNDIWGIID